MNWVASEKFESEIDALIRRYPQPRSAALMVLHKLQENCGCLTPEIIEWAAAKLGLRPINLLELVTFYPMFRQKPFGKFHLRICRTLSCALAGSHQLHKLICERLGLDPLHAGPQTTPDGMFTVEFVECLASCGTAPVLMCNDVLHEQMTPDKVHTLLTKCRSQAQSGQTSNLAAEHGFEP